MNTTAEALHTGPQVAVPDRVPGLPLDRLFAGYMAAAMLACAFPSRPTEWPLLVAVHLFVICLFWPLPVIGRVVSAFGPHARRRIRAVLDWTPLLVIPLLYTELAVLNRAVHGGNYFDDLIIAVEQAVFGGMPSDAWADAAPMLWLSEPLHAAYLSYYFIIFTPPLILFLRGRREDFRAGVFAVMLAFFVHYIFFIYFPVQGPRYLFAAPGGDVASGYFYGIAHKLLEAGSAQGSAFPSSHVGVSVAQTLVTMRLLPKFAPVIGLLTVGLALGAVYGGFHYATDVVAGLALGAAAFACARPLYERLRMRP